MYLFYFIILKSSVHKNRLKMSIVKYIFPGTNVDVKMCYVL